MILHRYFTVTDKGRHEVEFATDGVLVSSQLRGSNLHAPVIDIDHKVRLQSSKTPGHFHLYIEKSMSWRKYRRLLRAMVRAGLVEPGYYGASVARKATMVRAPWALDVDLDNDYGR